MSEPVERVLIVSDTHGELAAPIAALAGSADWVLHAGDIGSVSVMRKLAVRAATAWVVGNNDTPEKWPQGDGAHLGSLPFKRRLKLAGGAIGMEHGDRCRQGRSRHADLRARWPDVRMVVYGHTHKLVLDCDREPWVVNPGAAGATRVGAGASCLLLRTGSGPWWIAAVRVLRGEQQLTPVEAVAAWLA